MDVVSIVEFIKVDRDLAHGAPFTTRPFLPLNDSGAESSSSQSMIHPRRRAAGATGKGPPGPEPSRWRYQRWSVPFSHGPRVRATRVIGTGVAGRPGSLGGPRP